jgi:hypothetical protein
VRAALDPQRRELIARAVSVRKADARGPIRSTG